MKIHKGGKRKSHLRSVACSSCRAAATHKCCSCNTYGCSNCIFPHSTHILCSISLPKNLGVFFDMSSFNAITYDAFHEAIHEISIRIAQPKFVKLYCDGWVKNEKELECECIDRYGISPLDALLLDMSVLLNSGLTHILIVVSKVSCIQARLNHLNTPGVRVLIASSVLPLRFYDTRNSLPKIQHMLRRGSFCQEIQKAFSLTECKGISKSVGKVFLEESQLGNILIENSEIIQTLSTRLKITGEESAKYLEHAEISKVIQKSCINLHDLKLIFYSLKSTTLSIDVFTWVILSLKADEMIPSKRNIKCRLKQAYNIHITTHQWKLLSARLVSRYRSKSVASYNFSKENSIIFPGPSKWTGYDSFKNDKFDIKNLEYWDDFLIFLEKYFARNYKNSIPLGKYGCRLLIKFAGPDSLRYLSAGKILYLINQALTDDFLRFYDRKLVWSKDFKLITNQGYKKLEFVKQSLLKIVSDHPPVLNLSRLPFLFTTITKFKLDVKEFGYKTLKEFLLSISELEITPNLQVLIKKRRVCDKDLLLEKINEIIKEKEFGVSESLLQATLQAQISESIDWTEYNVASCEEFIKQYSKSSIEILHTPEYNIFFSPSEYRSYSYFFPFKSCFHSAVLETSRVPTPQGYHAVSYSFEIGPAARNHYPHMQRIINISNVPSDFMQMSPSRDVEGFDDMANEPFIIESLCSGERSVSNSGTGKKNYDRHGRTNSLCAVHSSQSRAIHISWGDINNYS